MLLLSERKRVCSSITWCTEQHKHGVLNNINMVYWINIRIHINMPATPLAILVLVLVYVLVWNWFLILLTSFLCRCSAPVVHCHHPRSFNMIVPSRSMPQLGRCPSQLSPHLPLHVNAPSLAYIQFTRSCSCMVSHYNFRSCSCICVVWIQLLCLHSLFAC